jgi:hypothetical protein
MEIKRAGSRPSTPEIVEWLEQVTDEQYLG